MTKKIRNAVGVWMNYEGARAHFREKAFGTPQAQCDCDACELLKEVKKGGNYIVRLNGDGYWRLIYDASQWPD